MDGANLEGKTINTSSLICKDFSYFPRKSDFSLNV